MDLKMAGDSVFVHFTPFYDLNIEEDQTGLKYKLGVRST